jgi:hypothetical protein
MEYTLDMFAKQPEQLMAKMATWIKIERKNDLVIKYSK